MIRINLLKGASSRRGKSAVSGALLVRIGIVVVAALVIVVAGAGILRWFLERPHTELKAVAATVPQPVPEKKVIPEKPTVVASQPLPEKKVVPEKATPEPEKKTVLEQVAAQQALSAPKAAEPVAQKKSQTTGEPVPYAMLSGAEKINYEIAFANKVLQTLTGTVVPEGVGFSSLSIDSFTTVSGHGTRVTKENVAALFKNLRRERFQLLEPPLSYIEPDPVQDFDFQFTSHVLFGADSADAFRPAEHLVPVKNLQSMVTTFLKSAAGCKLAVRHGLVRRAVMTKGEFRQFVYHCTCSGTYRDFVKFVLQVNKAHLPCAFTAVQIKVRSAAVFDIGTDVIFTTRK